MPARFLRRGSVALIASIACLGAALVTAPTDAQPGHHRLHPSAVPADTPNILDGRTYAIAEVGTKVFVGGTFTTAQNPGTSATISTPFLFKYDRLTGLVDTAFAPQLDAQVNAIVPSADGSALYVGGAFKKARTTNVRNVIKIDTATGALITAFKNPSPNGTVLDLALVGNRLFVAGSFTTMAHRAPRRAGGAQRHHRRGRRVHGHRRRDQPQLAERAGQGARWRRQARGIPRRLPHRRDRQLQDRGRARPRPGDDDPARRHRGHRRSRLEDGPLHAGLCEQRL